MSVNSFPFFIELMLQYAASQIKDFPLKEFFNGIYSFHLKDSNLELKLTAETAGNIQCWFKLPDNLFNFNPDHFIKSIYYYNPQNNKRVLYENSLYYASSEDDAGFSEK